MILPQIPYKWCVGGPHALAAHQTVTLPREQGKALCNSAKAVCTGGKDGAILLALADETMPAGTGESS